MTVPISIHALREEGDLPAACKQVGICISIHALREEGDALHQLYTLEKGEFLSTPSARRATQDGFVRLSFADNFYPRPPRGGRPGGQSKQSWHAIHFYPRPPRGGRLGESTLPLTLGGISIHALREEGDRPMALREMQPPFYFYPRPPRGGRHCYGCRLASARFISIHALREEGDGAARLYATPRGLFLSTPSARRATTRTPLHPPQRGGFLSTPSARRATEIWVFPGRCDPFLSTPSARRAT